MLSLTQGQKMFFAKEVPPVRGLVIDVSWTVSGSAAMSKVPVDINMHAFFLDRAGKCCCAEDMIFCGSTNIRGKAAKHYGKVKIGRECMERLKIDLAKVPSDVERIALTLSIYNGGQRGQSLVLLQNLSVLVVDGINNKKLCQFNAYGSFNAETAAIVGELRKEKEAWGFSAVMAAGRGGLPALCRKFGMEVRDEEEKRAVASVPEPPKPSARVLPPPPPVSEATQKIQPVMPHTVLQENEKQVLRPPDSGGNSAPAFSGVRIGGAPAQNAQVNNIKPDTSSPKCSCGASLRAGAKFCGHCGSVVAINAASPAPVLPQEKKCGNCGAVLRAGGKFCGGCGTVV